MKHSYFLANSRKLVPGNNWTGFAMSDHHGYKPGAMLVVILALPMAMTSRFAESPVFQLPDAQVHYRFSGAVETAITVPSRATVIADIRGFADGQVGPSSESDDLHGLDMNRVHPLTGPVFVEGAEPGETLAVTLFRIEPGKWGWSALFPGFGAPAEDFAGHYFRKFEFDGAKLIEFNDRIRIPDQPFPGLTGVSPATEEMLPAMPPRDNGGNTDNPGIRNVPPFAFQSL